MGIAFFPETSYVNPTADPTKDSFSRQRVTQIDTLFDSKQLVDNQPMMWDDQQVSGTATSTYNNANACTTIAVNNTTAGRRVRQTFRRFNYQPGKSQSILITATVGNSSNGIVKRLGYYDDNNGIFFQTVDGTMAFGTRKGGVDTIVPQANWIFDTMDGQGHSHSALDLTKTQIFSFDFEWLGAGSVRFGFIINGQFIIAHRADCANVLPSIYSQSPNQPLRYEIINTGTGLAASMDCICGTVMSEGGFDETGIVLSADRGITAFPGAASTNLYPILGIRLKTTAQMATIRPFNISVVSDAGNIFRWCVLLNPIIGGATPTFTDVTNSAVQIANSTVVGNTVTSTGTQLFSTYEASLNKTPFSGEQAFINFLAIGANIAGVSDQLWICAQQVTAVASN